MARTNQEIRQAVTASIIAALENGVSPWRRPWTTAGAPMPHNAASGHIYRGCNVFSLWAIQNACGYGSAQWLTFNQARGLGGSVRKGERASWAVFTKPLLVQAKPGEKGADENGKKKLFMLRVTPIFNVAQCDGVELPERERVVTRPVDESIANVVRELAASKSIDVRHGGDRAYFSPSDNYVRVPEASHFESTQHYAATLAHELVHSTGHESRLARTFGAFGSAVYAREELVAELGSAMLCAELGIASELVANHAAYIDSWLTLLRSDDKAIFKAARDAEAACVFLRGENDDGAAEDGAE